MAAKSEEESNVEPNIKKIRFGKKELKKLWNKILLILKNTFIYCKKSVFYYFNSFVIFIFNFFKLLYRCVTIFWTLFILIHILFYIFFKKELNDIYGIWWTPYPSVIILSFLIVGVLHKYKITIKKHLKIILKSIKKHFVAVFLLTIAFFMGLEHTIGIIRAEKSIHTIDLLDSYISVLPFVLVGTVILSIFLFFFPPIEYMKGDNNSTLAILKEGERDHLEYNRRRFINQIENLMINARNAQIAAYITLIMGLAIIMFLLNEDADFLKAEPTELAVILIQLVYYKILVAVITIFMSNKFFKQYEKNMADIRFLQNELTNLDTKITYISLLDKHIKKDNLIQVLEEVNKIERNFILQEGQNTINSKEFEISAKTENSISNLLKIISDFFKK